MLLALKKLMNIGALKDLLYSKEQIKLGQLTSTFFFRCTEDLQGILSFVKIVS